MVVQADEGRLTKPPRILLATAVPQERDAVARAFTEAAGERRLPGGTVLHRVRTAAHPGAPVADLLAAGVGPARAAAATASALTAAALAGEPYGLVVSAGIGGGFLPAAPVGSLVLAELITAADLGAESPEGFLPVTALGFGTVTHTPPPALVRRAAAALGCPAGEVLTVSTVTGSAARAAQLRARHPRALAEAMEGFGVAEAAAAHGCPVAELRAVSNPVGPRDRAAWKIPEAFAALTGGMRKFLPVLESWTEEQVPDRG
ncbi:futalosine hydrolase [Streptomyces sp. SCSIO ZS0520]|uniref:futalosine hydrolase n=1 Tax=Streptomyces sp. SCSIO ZS0520 TaxID=2892996 RepID=UPI0021DAB98B|nr:futalosine hydrolase [Streptomyces sp. SCSIO ZS0520]